MQKTDDRLAYLLTALTILGWSGAATAFKSALTALSPVQLLCIAAAVSLVLLTLLTMASGRGSQLRLLKPEQWLQLLLLGALNPFLYYMVLFRAYDLLPGQVAMSLNYLWPVVLALLSVPILGHRLSRTSLISVVLSFFGAFIIATRGELTAWGQLDLSGILLALISTLIWALYWLLSARIAVDPVLKLTIGFLAGTSLSLLYALLYGHLPVAWQSIPWLPVLYVGLFEMGITFFLWLLALQYSSNAAKIGNLIYLTPFLSLVLLWFILGEEIYASTFIGLSVIICAILLQQTGSERAGGSSRQG